MQRVLRFKGQDVTMCREILIGLVFPGTEMHGSNIMMHLPGPNSG